jgi:hypothetical protein
VVYTVVYQLTDGTVKSESWSVGATSPETIAQVRTAVGSSGPGNSQFATQAYVNTALATVVHLNGTETITGTKQFAVSPILPAPSQDGQAVNKAYVDASVATTGAGSFVSKAGDTMSGPLTLPSEALGNRQITDEQKFRDGLGKLVDGAVQCLNASAWAQKETANPLKASAPQS